MKLASIEGTSQGIRSLGSTANIILGMDSDFTTAFAADSVESWRAISDESESRGWLAFSVPRQLRVIGQNPTSVF